MLCDSRSASVPGRSRSIRLDAGGPLSRRHFLATNTGVLAACTAAQGVPPRIPDGNLLDPRQRSWNAAHVSLQLHIYRDHFLPWLLRRPQVDASFAFVGLAGPDPTDMAAYRATTDGLMRLLERDGTHGPEPDFAAVLEPARSRLCDTARSHLLRHHEVDRAFVESRCAATDPGPAWSWRCSALGFLLPDAILASYWADIRDVLGLHASAQPSSLASVEPRHLIRCFRRLPADDYFRLMPGLVQMYPAVPVRLFSIPDESRLGDRSRYESLGIDGGPHTRGRVSHLFGVALEFLANNEFGRLGPLVKRVEMCGSWLPFIAGQVLDVLYQKTLVLVWLSPK